MIHGLKIYTMTNPKLKKEVLEIIEEYFEENEDYEFNTKV